MNHYELITNIVCGGVLGMLGQGLRAVAGLKKANDAASATGQSFSDVFEPRKLAVSMFIGFLAGAFALLGASMSNAAYKLDNSSIMTVLAAGYAGTDFLDAFISKALPGSTPAALPPNPYG